MQASLLDHCDLGIGKGGAEVIMLDAEGLQRTEIAERLGIGVASVYRVLADAKEPAAEQVNGGRKTQV